MKNLLNDYGFELTDRGYRLKPNADIGLAKNALHEKGFVLMISGVKVSLFKKEKFTKHQIEMLRTWAFLNDYQFLEEETGVKVKDGNMIAYLFPKGKEIISEFLNRNEEITMSVKTAYYFLSKANFNIRHNRVISGLIEFIK